MQRFGCGEVSQMDTMYKEVKQEPMDEDEEEILQDDEVHNILHHAGVSE